MRIRQDLKRLGRWLNRDYKLNTVQLIALLAVLLIPVVLIIDSTYHTRYELQANYEQLESNDMLINELADKNQQTSVTLEEKNKLIKEQEKDIKRLQSDNQVLSGNLAATQTALSQEQAECSWGDWQCHFDKKNEDEDKKKIND